MTREDIRRHLIRGARGSLSEWRRACDIAKSNGWTQDEVDHILSLYHPMTWVVIGLIALIFCGLIGSALAHNGHVAQLPPGKEHLDSWINSLRSRAKTHCCSKADGLLVELFWEANGKYRVKYENKWYEVPDSAVIETPNLAGRAMVWWDIDELGNRKVRCFISGDLT